MNSQIIPPRGLLGRFMPRIPVASFVYSKPNGEVSVRKVIVNPEESMGDYIKGFDIGRHDFRTFKRGSIVGGVSVSQKYLDTVSLTVRDGR